MTRLVSAAQSLRQARGRLSHSWQRTAGGWKDKRAREFERRYQAPLEGATLAFERSIARLDQELSRVEKELPRD
jgi:hypothetical protein